MRELYENEILAVRVFHDAMRHEAVNRDTAIRILVQSALEVAGSPTDPAKAIANERWFTNRCLEGLAVVNSVLPNFIIKNGEVVESNDPNYHLERAESVLRHPYLL